MARLRGRHSPNRYALQPGGELLLLRVCLQYYVLHKFPRVVRTVRLSCTQQYAEQHLCLCKYAWLVGGD